MDLADFVRARAAVRAPGPPELTALLARESIRDLAVLYAMAVDACDVRALELMFHPEVSFNRDGDIARGREAVLELLRGSMNGFRRMVHTPETHVVHVAGGCGTGVATAHAELVTRRGVIVAAHEYEDAYGVYDGRWVFTSRRVRFVYATRASDYSSTLPEDDRVRLPGEPPRAMRSGWFDTAP